MIIVAGLGNFEAKYLKTRHNVGFIIVDELFRKHKHILTYNKYQSCIAQIKIRRHDLLLVKPYTYMNLSGQAIKQVVNANNIVDTKSDLIVIQDDVDLEFGKIKVKNSGRDAGHRGIKNIIENLGTDSFIRIKVGVGKPEKTYETADYVLDNFKDDEYEYLVNEVSNKINSFISQYLEIGYSKAKSICAL